MLVTSPALLFLADPLCLLSLGLDIVMLIMLHVFVFLVGKPGDTSGISSSVLSPLIRGLTYPITTDFSTLSVPPRVHS